MAISPRNDRLKGAAKILIIRFKMNVAHRCLVKVQTPASLSAARIRVCVFSLNPAAARYGPKLAIFAYLLQYAGFPGSTN